MSQSTHVKQQAEMKRAGLGMQPAFTMEELMKGSRVRILANFQSESLPQAQLAEGWEGNVTEIQDGKIYIQIDQLQSSVVWIKDRDSRKLKVLKDSCHSRYAEGKWGVDGKTWQPSGGRGSVCGDEDKGDVPIGMRAQVFVGNPGVGKSTLANNLAGKAMFASGMGKGTGLTYQLDWEIVEGRLYIDTPGLADPEMRRQAAEAITKALKRGGSYQICFVCLEDSGRIRAEDKTTMRLVLEAAPEIGSNYGIIFNRVTKKVLKHIKIHQEEIEACFLKGLPATKHICYAPFVEDLVGEENGIVELDADVKKFILNLPLAELTPEKVKAVHPGEFDHMLADVAAAQRQAEETRDAAIKARDEANQAREDLAKERQAVQRETQKRNKESESVMNELLRRENGDREREEDQARKNQELVKGSRIRIVENFQSESFPRMQLAEGWEGNLIEIHDGQIAIQIDELQSTVVWIKVQDSNKLKVLKVSNSSVWKR